MPWFVGLFRHHRQSKCAAVASGHGRLNVVALNNHSNAPSGVTAAISIGIAGAEIGERYPGDEWFATIVTAVCDTNAVVQSVYTVA